MTERVIAALTGSGGAVTVLLAAALWIFSNLGVILLLFMVGLETRVQEMARVGVPAALVAIAGVVVVLLVLLLHRNFASARAE